MATHGNKRARGPQDGEPVLVPEIEMGVTVAGLTFAQVLAGGDFSDDDDDELAAATATTATATVGFAAALTVEKVAESVPVLIMPKQNAGSFNTDDGQARSARAPPHAVSPTGHPHAHAYRPT